MIRIGEFILFCLLFCSGVGTNVCCSISTLLTYFLGFDIPTILILLFRFFHVHSLQWLQTYVSLNYAIWECCIFMARRAIPMITFPRVRTIYMWMRKSVICKIRILSNTYIQMLIIQWFCTVAQYNLVSPTRVCSVKEVTSFPGARSINRRGA